MKNNLQDFASASEQEIDFSDLQPLFNNHSRRLADILDRPEASPVSLNLSDTPTFRLRMARAWGILALLCLSVTLLWGIALWYHNYDIYYRIFTLFLELVYILLTVESVVTTLTILRHDPARVSFDCMLHFARRSGMRPLYMPQKKSRLAAFIASFHSRRPTPHTLSYAFNPQFVIDNLKHTATIVIAAALTIIFIACATTVGDGHTMTQDHNARIEAVNNVTHTINNIHAL